MKKKGTKEKLKPISFYGLGPEDTIRAFMQIDPKKLEIREEEEKTELSKQTGCGMKD